MLDSLVVKNFKSLREATLTFSKLTLLVGPNNSGKSTIFQAILALKQTMESRNFFTPFVLNGRYVQLGAFENIVYGKDPKQKIAIEARIRASAHFLYAVSRWRTRSLDEFLASTPEGKLDLSSIAVGFSLGYTKSTRKIRRGESRVLDGRGRELVRLEPMAITNLMGRSVNLPIKGSNVRVGKASFHLSSSYFIPSISSEREREPHDLDARLLFGLQGVLSFTRAQFDDRFTHYLFYLGPLRDYPKRYYFATGEVPRT